MSTISDIWVKVTGALTRALTFNVQKIDAIVAQIQKDVAVAVTDIEYVGNFVVNEGPTLIADAQALLAEIKLFPVIPTSVSVAITAAIAVLQTIITAIEQVTQQGSGAQSLANFGGTDHEVAIHGYATHASLVSTVAVARMALAAAKKK